MSGYRISCPSCAAQINVQESLLGKSARCPRCQELIRIPPPEVEEDDPLAGLEITQEQDGNGIEIDDAQTSAEQLRAQGYVSWRCPRCRQESLVLAGREPLLCQDCMTMPASARTMRAVNYIASRQSPREASAAEGCAAIACSLIFVCGVLGVLMAAFVGVMVLSGNAPALYLATAVGGGISSLILVAIGGVGAALLKRKS